MTPTRRETDRIPPEPALGTRVRDRHGAESVRRIDSDGRDGWSPGPGFYSLARWEPMWRRRGPLTIVGKSEVLESGLANQC